MISYRLLVYLFVDWSEPAENVRGNEKLNTNSNQKAMIDLQRQIAV